ncbi:DUF6193 family natural product biosynthesis protein [Streptomyces tauricus]|uniref:DUF6193 family natural product biosynthesis protein n=1 Tax=Streptomyces tauricus TaxID=68274 RepID=UPI0038062608
MSGSPSSLWPWPVKSFTTRRTCRAVTQHHQRFVQPVHVDATVVERVVQRAELLEAAYAEPHLWQLFPWTGRGELHFSRCTAVPWSWDVPYIQPAAEGTYWLSGLLRTETVGPASTAQEAIATVVGRLPARCGPVFTGTPEELNAHEATTRKSPSD